MSILIKGMEMPTSCIFCELYEADWHWCRAAKKEYHETIENKAHPDWCPLVHVPPHGDLIDRDKLREKEFVHDGDAYAVVMARDIRNAPTIIPAEEE